MSSYILGLLSNFNNFVYLKQTLNQSPTYLVHHHQNIWNPVMEQFKVIAICQAYFITKIPNVLQGQQLRSVVVKNCISHQFSRENLLQRKSLVLCILPLKSVFFFTQGKIPNRSC